MFGTLNFDIIEAYGIQIATRPTGKTQSLISGGNIDTKFPVPAASTIDRGRAFVGLQAN